MDQNSGEASGRSAPKRERRTLSEHQLDEHPPPGPAYPLPRRSAQEHMEPQLRRPGSTGPGIPFDPFDPFAVEDKPARPPEPPDEATNSAKSTGAAAFKKGSGRGRRRVDPPVE